MRARARTSRPTARTPMIAVAALVLALAGCATPGPGDEADPGSTGSPTAPDPQPDDDAPVDPAAQPLVRIAHVGGFVPMGWDFSNVAELTLYADGLAISHGPTTLEYPGPLLPNLRTHELDAQAVTALLDAAGDAGLLGADVDYGMPPIADAGATQVTIRLDGAEHVHRAEALDLTVGEAAGEDLGLDPAAVEARGRLAGFVEAVRTAVGGAPETGAYSPDAFAVMARPASDAGADADVAPATHDWPIDVPLEGADCTVVEGQDAVVLGEVLAQARAGDRFERDGALHEVWVRVLLPGDAGCTQAERAPAG